MIDLQKLDYSEFEILIGLLLKREGKGDGEGKGDVLKELNNSNQKYRYLII